MILETTKVILAMGAPASPPGTTPDPRTQILGPVGMLVLMVVFFYFALIRPQQKKAKEQANLLKSIKAGDKVMVSGGIVAVVVTVKEKTVTVRSADSKFEVIKTAVTEILERESGQS